MAQREALDVRECIQLVNRCDADTVQLQRRVLKQQICSAGADSEILVTEHSWSCISLLFLTRFYAAAECDNLHLLRLQLLLFWRQTMLPHESDGERSLFLLSLLRHA